MFIIAEYRSSNESPDLDLSTSLVAVDDVARFRDQRQGFFKKKPLKDVLKWQKFPIRKSLLRLTRKDNTTAVQIFATIRMFMGEQATKTPRELLSKRVCSTGLSCPSLRDEIFLQLCKQTNANPNLENAIEGWKVWFSFIVCYLIVDLDSNCHFSAAFRDLCGRFRAFKDVRGRIIDSSSQHSEEFSECSPHPFRRLEI